MNTRQNKIILELINFENETIANLAVTFNVSYRTIQNDIQQINSEIQKYDACIITNTSNGVHIQISDDYKEKLLANLNDAACNENEQIIFDVLEQILYAEEYVKLDDLSEKLFISRKSLSIYLKDVKKILSNYNLKLVSKPGYGLKLEQEEGALETKIRRLILFCKHKNNKFYPITFSDELCKKVESIIRKYSDEYQYVTTQEGMEELKDGILIAATRIKQNKMNEYGEEVISYISEIQEFSIAQKLVKEIGNILSIQYDVQETCYVARLLRAHRRLTKDDIEKLQNNIRDELDELINSILNEIESKFQINLHNDLDLYVGLGMHLVPLISRIQFNVHLNNPIIEEVKRNYMLAFDMATTASKVIEEKFDIVLSEDEVGYLATHLNLALVRQNSEVQPKNILVVCSSGGGLAKLLEYKIKQNFGPMINDIDTCNMYELRNIDMSKYDYVLTTVKLDYQPAKPTLQISHMLTSDDVKKVTNVLNETSSTKTLLDVSTNELFFNDIKAKSKEEVIEKICEKLKNRIPLQKDFVEQIFNREKVYSTEIGNGVVFPHPLVSTTPITFISITVLNKPILWDNEMIQVVMISNTKVGESAELQTMYDQFAQFVSNKHNIVELIKKPEYKTFEKLVEMEK